MPRMIRLLVLAAAAVLLLVAPAPDRGAHAEPGSQPVVVELYTSQGCNSCPPADAFLTELAARDDVLALSMHVDYWNYIGWHDPFSRPEVTERQRGYVKALGLRVVYTPQMVIDGRHDVVGTDRGAVEKAIGEAASRRHLAVALAGDARAGFRVSLPQTTLEEPATVWLVLYDRAHETPVKRGENAGRTIRNSNVVRAIVPIGRWSGEATAMVIDVTPAQTAGRDACAVIVQHGETGPVLGAATMAIAP